MLDFKEKCKAPLETQLSKFLKGIRVQLTYLKTSNGDLKTKVVAGLAREPFLGADAERASFIWDEINSNVTVQQYYLRSICSPSRSTLVTLIC